MNKCEIFNSKDNTKVIKRNGKTIFDFDGILFEEIKPQEVETLCDGKSHIWLDENKSEWGCECPHYIKNQFDNKVAQKQREFKDQVKTFLNFNTNINDFKKEIEQIKGFIENKSDKNLIISGNNGTGKTHLLKALCYECMKLNYKTDLLSSIKLSELLKSSINYDLENIERLNRIKENYIDFLFIDDLGNENLTEFFDSNFCELLNDYKGKMVITTNIKIELMKYSNRLKSRLLEKLIDIKLIGKDYRRENVN